MLTGRQFDDDDYDNDNDNDDDNEELMLTGSATRGRHHNGPVRNGDAEVCFSISITSTTICYIVLKIINQDYHI